VIHQRPTQFLSSPSLRSLIVPSQKKVPFHPCFLPGKTLEDHAPEPRSSPSSPSLLEEEEEEEERV